jgi:T-complex protein 1 subunit eta
LIAGLLSFLIFFLLSSFFVLLSFFVFLLSSFFFLLLSSFFFLLSSSFFFLLSSQFTDEAERSLHDAISVVRRARKQSQSVVAGGGAIEMEVSKYLRSYSRTIHGKAQLIVNAYARALEVIPRTISQNAGLDSVDILNKLRHKHAQGGTWFGIDIETGGICDTYKSFVWEPTLV